VKRSVALARHAELVLLQDLSVVQAAEQVKDEFISLAQLQACDRMLARVLKFVSV